MSRIELLETLRQAAEDHGYNVVVSDVSHNDSFLPPDQFTLRGSDGRLYSVRVEDMLP